MTGPIDFSSFVAHWRDIEGEDDNHYPRSDELQTISASFGEKFGLMRLGIHHERLKPGRRVSWPHAEADEEEFVFVLEGEPDLWADGHVRRLKPGDGVAFPSGTGLAHTILNNTDQAGLAGKVRDWLAGKQVTVNEVGNTPSSTNTNTIIRVYTGKVWTGKYLAALLGLSEDRIQQGGDGLTSKDVSIVVGPDIQPILSSP